MDFVHRVIFVIFCGGKMVEKITANFGKEG